MNDLISRQAALDAIEKIYLPQTKGETATEEINRVAWRCALNCAEEMVKHLPSAKQWIPVKYRPMTEEEREYWLEILEYEFDDNMMFDCQMPDDGQKILVCSKCGNIWLDTHEDDGGIMGLEENGDWETIVAWMPLPEPYKEVK